MNNTILNWNETDHRSIYLRQLKESPLYYVPNLNLWVVYSYAYCKAILQHEDAYIPEAVINDTLSDKGKLLLYNMARLGNGEHHDSARAAAMTVFKKIKEARTGLLLEELLSNTSTGNGFDWVETIAKQLPVRIILKGLDFENDDSNYIAEILQPLVRIMLPNKSEQDILMLNPVIDAVYHLAEKYAGSSGLLTGESQTDEMIICNLTGLFIQCYDAGRGLLCNTLLNMAKYADDKTPDWKKLVDETLRYEPPVHNTRRVAKNDISIGGQTIKAGETILVMLAAANLDDDVFSNPQQFDIKRGNNDQNLTFGLGGHNCLAKYFCIDMAADVCRFLAENYRQINILQKDFSYEQQLNVRLVKQLIISLK
jgi:cytochrome P450